MPADCEHLLQRFLRDPSSAIWVADGYLLTSKKWWGENRNRAKNLLRRIELNIPSEQAYFAAGSMYWIKPFTLGMLRAIDIESTDFESESGLLDGTTAHAVERVIGELVRASGQRIIETSTLRNSRPNSALVRPRYISAFYLPQFHRIPENDRWWGDGFTEWTAVNRAHASYNNHLQHHPTAPLGQYDLSDPSVMAKQSALAMKAGIDAFCVYFYWFGESRLLERPLDNLLNSPEVEFPFYLCWANESWRRNWDGMSGEVLKFQDYPDGFERALAKESARYMRDSRYQKPDGTRPRFVVYRPEDLPDPAGSISKLRHAWRDLGIGEVEIGAVKFHSNENTPEDLVDFWIEMPPHGLFRSKDCLAQEELPSGLNAGFRGLLYAYDRLKARSSDPAYAQSLPSNTIRGVMPSWDNTARRGDFGHIAVGATPAGFRAWLHKIFEDGIANSYGQELIINAWNEWGEKAMLEPSERFGDLNLRALEELVRN